MKYEIQYIPVGKLKRNPENPRRLSKKRFDSLRKSMTECPDLFKVRPCIVSDRTGELIIIAGNMRYTAAKKLKHKEVPAIIMSGLTEAKEKEIAIKDNVISGEWDMDALASWDNLPLADWGVDIPEDWLTEEKAEPADAEPQIDRAEELNKTWRVKSGDLWQIGEHRLLCGDSTKKEDAEAVMRGERAVLCFTDPPYGVSIGKKNVMLNTFQKAGRCLADLDMDDMPPAELKVLLLKAFTTCRETAMGDNCAVFVCSPQGGGLGMMMMMMMQEAGLEARHILNWVKNSPTFSMGRLDYDYAHEPILFTWTKTHKRNKKGAFQTSLWAVDKPRANKEHPTMKPVELPTCAILNHTDEGDVVVDIFGGSGTTMVAAQNTKRLCRMIEISPAYCAVILQRMTDAFPGIEIKRIE